MINIRGKSDSDLWKVMIHETVHLLLHQYIIKYEVSHWKKERIVDLLVQKFFPNSTELQNVPIETDTIDLLFRDNFPKIEEVIKKLD